jgi:hypothetical protein
MVSYKRVAAIAALIDINQTPIAALPPLTWLNAGARRRSQDARVDKE